MIVNKNIIVMCSEPSPEITFDVACEMYSKVVTEKELADVYAIVENKAWWVEDNEYDFEEGSEEHQEAIMITRKWFALADRIKTDIFEILRLEGVRIPRTRQIVVLEPFMKRNGYRDGNGWWIKKSSPDEHM